MDKREKVNEDCTLYENSRSRFIYADIKMPDGKRTRVSTRALNFADAKVAAQAIMNKMQYAADYGLTYQTKRFKEVAALWIKQLEEEVKIGLRTKRTLLDYKSVTERYLVGYFGTKLNKKIDMINANDIAEFWEWRKRYMVDGPGSKLKEREYKRNGKLVKAPVTDAMKRLPNPSNKFATERTALTQLFKYAVTKEWVKSGSVPILVPATSSKRKHKTKYRRPAFTQDELDKLFKFAKPWIDKGRNDREKWYRELLYDYITILRYTGMRTGTELINLRWSDVEFKTNSKGYSFVWLSIDGKTGKRSMPFDKRIVESLQSLIARRRKYQSDVDKMFLDEASQQNERVFVLRDGKEIRSMHSTWNRLLKDSGLGIDKQGKKRTLYSLRHSFATERLERGKVNSDALAKFMGTSVQMLNDHYDHIEMADMAEYLHRMME